MKHIRPMTIAKAEVPTPEEQAWVELTIVRMVIVILAVLKA